MRLTPPCYGMDLAGDRVLVVRRHGARAEVVLDTASGPGEREQVRAQLTRAIAQGRALLAAAAGAHESVLRRIAVPLEAAEKARRVLPALLDVELPFPLEKCVFDFPSLTPTAGGQMEALAVAVRREEWTALLRRAAEAIAEPTHLDHEGLAVWDQGRLECPELGEGLHAVLYVGVDHVTCALGRGSRLIAAPALRRGAESAATVVARLAPTLRALLGNEADKAFPWLLAGPGLDEPGTAAAIRAALPAGSEPRVAREAAAFLARALARRAAGGCALPCALRQGADEHAALRLRREAAVTRAQAIALAAGLALLVGSIAWRGWLSHREEALRATLNREAVAVTGLSRVPRGQEVELARRALKDRAARTDPFVAGVAGSTLEGLTRLAAATQQAGATLERLHVAGPAFELAGRAADWAAGERLVANLAAQGWAADLVRGDAGADERVPFTVKGTR